MELSQFLLQIDRFKKEADTLPVNPDFEKVFWDKFRLEFNYNSNHIEGNTLTYGHTQLLLTFDRIGGEYTGREIEEMKAHDLALKMIKNAAVEEDQPLTEKFIREINKLILVRPFYKEAITKDGQPTQKLITPGRYKTHPNSVLLENGETFDYASPEDTPILMGELLEWYNKETASKELHPVLLAGLFHYRFVRIHPFDDSNGRTARLMMNYILLKNGYTPVVIKSQEKRNYLAALNKADTGDIESFTTYITDIALYWQELYLQALKGEKIEEETDFEKEVEILKKNLSKNKELKTEISNETVINLFDNSLLPLLQAIEVRSIKLQELFFKSRIELKALDGSVNATIGNLADIDSLRIYFYNFTKGGTLSVVFQHEGFKSPKNGTFNYFLSLNIVFDRYTYRIHVLGHDEFFIENPYGYNINEREIEDMSSKLARLELEYIRNRTN